jgi:molybdopterin converting factor small subunit
VSVTVRLPTIMRTQAGGQAEVSAEGTTVGEVVEDLIRQFPGTAKHLQAPDGGLHRFVNIYVDDDDIRYLQGKETPVADGAQVSILPAVAGGAR